MIAREMIDEFAEVGVRLTAENGQISFEGPREVLTSERIEELRQHKAELLAALTAPDLDALEERAALIHEAHTIAIDDDGAPLLAPISTLARGQAEKQAAQEQGRGDADSFYGDAVIVAPTACRRSLL